MNCPFCGEENIPGSDACESCGEDLTAFDGVRPQDSLEASLLKDEILAVAKCEALVVSSQTPIQEVAQKIDRDNNCCLVIENDQLVGVVTIRDILQKAILKDFDLNKTPIATIMTPNPEILNSNDHIVHALNKMAIGGYRHIPIKKDDHSYVVISVRDILAYLAHKLPHVVAAS